MRKKSEKNVQQTKMTLIENEKMNILSAFTAVE
jgi:hypothetical protein